jgi:hypothetical protein
MLEKIVATSSSSSSSSFSSSASLSAFSSSSSSLSSSSSDQGQGGGSQVEVGGVHDDEHGAGKHTMGGVREQAAKKAKSTKTAVSAAVAAIAAVAPGDVWSNSATTEAAPVPRGTSTSSGAQQYTGGGAGGGADMRGDTEGDTTRGVEGAVGRVASEALAAGQIRCQVSHLPDSETVSLTPEEEALFMKVFNDTGRVLFLALDPPLQMRYRAWVSVCHPPSTAVSSVTPVPSTPSVPPVPSMSPGALSSAAGGSGGQGEGGKKRARPGEQQTPRCGKGHALEPATTTKEMGCDGCSQVFEVGSTLHGCTECDYDLCGECVEKRRRSTTSTRRRHHKEGRHGEGGGDGDGGGT